MTEAIGWFSSFILVLTLAKQVHKLWRSGSSEGVSEWLFVGQVTASAGFTLYSVLVHNWVFVVTNALLLVSAIVGGLIVIKHRRATRRTHLSPYHSGGSARIAAPAQGPLHRLPLHHEG